VSRQATSSCNVAAMVGAGKQVGDARVWTAPSESRTISELVRDRGGLFLFYLFDWSST
jgi:hypothetical protein